MMVSQSIPILEAIRNGEETTRAGDLTARAQRHMPTPVLKGHKQTSWDSPPHHTTSQDTREEVEYSSGSIAAAKTTPLSILSG